MKKIKFPKGRFPIVISALLVLLLVSIVGQTMLVITPDVAEVGRTTTLVSSGDMNCYPPDGYVASWRFEYVPTGDVSYKNPVWVSNGQTTMTTTFDIAGMYWVQVFYYEDLQHFYDIDEYCVQDVFINVKDDAVQPDECNPQGAKKCVGKEIRKCDYVGTESWLSWRHLWTCTDDERCVEDGTDAYCKAIPVTDPDPEPDPEDLCKGVSCPTYCEGSVLFTDGYCEVEAGNAACVYEHVNCQYGCEGDICKADSDEPFCEPPEPQDTEWSECVDELQHRVVYHCGTNGEWVSTTLYAECAEEGISDEELIILGLVTAMIFGGIGFVVWRSKTSK